MNRFLIIIGQSALAFVVVSILLSMLLMGVMWIGDAVTGNGINLPLAIRSGVVFGGILFFVSLYFGLKKTPAIPEPTE